MALLRLEIPPFRAMRAAVGKAGKARPSRCWKTSPLDRVSAGHLAATRAVRRPISTTLRERHEWGHQRFEWWLLPSSLCPSCAARPVTTRFTAGNQKTERNCVCALPVLKGPSHGPPATAERAGGARGGRQQQ